MDNDQLAILWEQYLSGRMSRSERATLSSMLQNPAFQEQFENLVNSSFAEQPLNPIPDAGKEAHILQVLQKINAAETSAPRIPFFKRTWLRYAAAAILILGAGTYFLLKPKPAQNSGIAVNNNVASENIQPGGDKATLTLADGSVIVLDSASDGAIASQGNTSIIKLAGGNIAYDQTGTTEAVTTLNTMRTPAGGKYQLLLPDGTKVWLNASSSITFPVNFVSQERNVSITGEAYFEVKQDKSRPFSVSGGNARILVLGTAFNVNAYEDEKQLKVTLLNGGVRVTDAPSQQATVLLPGQQAQLAANKLSTINNVDLSKVLAWKNDLFNFEDAGIEEAMRQISRWYNVKVKYENGIPPIQLWGKMRRNTSFNDLLKNLKDIGVHYRIDDENRILTILP